MSIAIEKVKELRVALDTFEKQMLDLKVYAGGQPTVENENRGEVLANVMLAYRHIEDARMRLGKVIQAFEGGVSIYDKAPVSSSTGGVQFGGVSTTANQTPNGQ